MGDVVCWSLFGCSQNPKDFYPVGNRVEYSCLHGYYLSGDAVAECTENQKWTRGAMICKSTSAISYFTFQMQTWIKSEVTEQEGSYLKSFTQKSSFCSRLHVWDSSSSKWSYSHAYQRHLWDWRGGVPVVPCGVNVGGRGV